MKKADVKRTIAVVFILVAAFSAVILLVYLPREPEPTPQAIIAPELRRIASSNPAYDFRDAVSRGDFRLVGLKTVGLETPGVQTSAEHLKYTKLLGVRIIEGTSDVLSSKEHGELQEKVRQYAAAYNTLVLEHLRENPSILKSLSKDSL
jgi:hypothetical protein